MIYVECRPDEILVRQVTDLPRRQVVHEIKGKGEVCNRLMRNRDLVAMVDEDPEATQPKYMTRLFLDSESADLGLKLYLDRSLNNRIVVLCPKLEEWLLRAAADSGLSMNTYGLPDRANPLHSEINLDERKIQRLLADLHRAKSPRLRALGRLLTP